MTLLKSVECCAPYTLETELSQYTEANGTVTTAECGVPNCADSYFGDFAKSLNTLNDPLTGCSSGVKVRLSFVSIFEDFLRCDQFMMHLGLRDGERAADAKGTRQHCAILFTSSWTWWYVANVFSFFLEIFFI